MVYAEMSREELQNTYTALQAHYDAFLQAVDADDGMTRGNYECIDYSDHSHL